MWLVSGGCAAITISARPEGALLAALIGTAGVSLYSPPIRSLLWAWQDDVPGMFACLRTEVVLLTAVLLGSAVVIALVRAVAASCRPQWMWRSPLADARDEGAKQQSPPAADKDNVNRKAALHRAILESLGLVSDAPTDKPATKRETVVKSLCFLAVGTAVAVVVILLSMRSSDRGQILFSLLASFVLGVIVAHQIFPGAYSIAAWLMPPVTAIMFYSLAGNESATGAQAWMAVPAYSRALPVDWLTAGCGGAVLGYWICRRLHEVHHIERRQEQDTQGA